MNESPEAYNPYGSPQRSASTVRSVFRTLTRVATLPLALMLGLFGYRLWEAQQYALSEMTIQRVWIATGAFAVLLVLAILFGWRCGTEKPVE